MIRHASHSTYGERESQRRKVNHACDNCRQKKMRCAGYEDRPDGCEACRLAQIHCTFSERRQRASHDRIRELEMQVEAYKVALETVGHGAKVPIGQLKDESTSSSHDEEMAFIEPFYQPGDSSPFQAIPVILKATEAMSTPSDEPPSAILGAHPRSTGQTTVYTSALDAQGSVLTHFEEGLGTHQTSFTSLLRRVDAVWPNKSMETQLVNAFFTHADACYPLLERSEFDKELGVARNQQTREWLMIALAVFIIGSRCDRAIRNAEDEMRWYALVREMGTGLDWIPTPNVLQHTQASLVLTIFMWSTQLTSTVAWDMLGKVCRVMQSVGVHRDLTARKLAWSKSYADAWCRAWWVAYVLDVEQACQLGRPPAIADADVDLRFERLEQCVGDEQIAKAFKDKIVVSRIAKDALAKLYGPLSDRSCLPALEKRLGHSIAEGDGSIMNNLCSTTNAFLKTGVEMFMHKRATIARLLEVMKDKSADKSAIQAAMTTITTPDSAVRSAQKLVEHAIRLREAGLLLYGGTAVCLRLVDATFILVVGLLTLKMEQKKLDAGLLLSCREATRSLLAFDSIMPIARRCLELLRIVQKRLTIDLGISAPPCPGLRPREGDDGQEQVTWTSDGSAWPAELFDFGSGSDDESQLWSFLQFQ